MLPDKFIDKLPLIQKWITETLASFKTHRKPVSEWGFSRLPLFYTINLLENSYVVVVDKLPMPPLTSFGLYELAAFETADFAAITYLDTFFIKRTEVTKEPTFFHELIHIIQWQHLGVKEFLIKYALGLLTGGYAQNPLEIMAYHYQGLFEQGCTPYNVEKEVILAINSI